jgi:hypothetical protein
MIVVKADLRALNIFDRAVQLLGRKEAEKIGRFSLNQVGDKLRTKVKRQTAKQLGLPYGKTEGAWKIDRAHGAHLVYAITGSGKYYGLEDFKPRQFKKGARAKPWNIARTFPGSFMLPSGKVYVRLSIARGPLGKLMGGSVPREMERDDVPKLAQDAMHRELPAVLDRKLAQFLPF